MQEQLASREVPIHKPPLYVPGVIRISHLASTPEGFTIQTRHTLRMKEGLTKQESQPEEFTLGSPLRAKASSEMRQEMLRTLKQVMTLSEADEQLFLKPNRAPEENSHIHSLIKSLNSEQHRRYNDLLLTTRKTGLRSARKIGIENLVVEDNTITVDVKNPYYRMYAAIPPTASEETRELAHPAAVAMVVQTADNYLVLQYRKAYDPEKKIGNRFYGGIPGVSAAGYFDAPKGPQGTGKPGEINNIEVVKMATREAQEELGLVPEALTHVAITGIAQDFLKPHDELLLFAKTDKTSTELRSLRISEETAQSEYDFSESFYTIPSTPDAVERLLTKVHIPLPPTHVAAFFAAGHALALEQLGPDAAKQWAERVEKGIQNNFSHIDHTVKLYWQKRMHAVASIADPEERSKQQNLLLQQTKTITIDRYDPQLSAEQQGLPSLSIELQRTELIERTPHHAWLFDIDGVITNPKEKRITQPEMVRELVNKLQRGEPIALITGRALPWVEDRVINELTRYMKDHGLEQDLLDNVFVAGEFGGCTITFHNGEAYRSIDPTISIPPDIIHAAKDITHKYEEWVFTDEAKQTQYTVELQQGKDIAAFHAGIRNKMADEYRKLLKNKGVDPEKLEVHEDRIAINIRSRKADKRYATRQFLTWLAKHNITPERYIAFGDSPNDLEMGIELYTQGKSFEFAYTGDVGQDLGGRELQFPIRSSGLSVDPNHTDTATLTILQNMANEQQTQ